MPFHQQDKNHVQVTLPLMAAPVSKKNVWSFKKEFSEFGMILYES